MDHQAQGAYSPAVVMRHTFKLCPSKVEFDKCGMARRRFGKLNFIRGMREAFQEAVALQQSFERLVVLKFNSWEVWAHLQPETSVLPLKWSNGSLPSWVRKLSS